MLIRLRKGSPGSPPGPLSLSWKLLKGLLISGVSLAWVPLGRACSTLSLTFAVAPFPPATGRPPAPSCSPGPGPGPAAEVCPCPAPQQKPRARCGHPSPAPLLGPQPSWLHSFSWLPARSRTPPRGFGEYSLKLTAQNSSRKPMGFPFLM